MRALSAAASGVRHAVGAIAEASLIVAIVAALAFSLGVFGRAPAGASEVNAATKGYSITIVGPVGAAATAITYGDSVATYSVYGSANPAYARLRCVANSSTVTNLAVGAQVYDVFLAIREGTWNTGGYATFSTTASRAWTGGGAACTASLMTYTMHNADRIWKTLASTSFSVLP